MRRLLLHWKRLSRVCTSEGESVSKSSELKNTTDLYEEGRLLTWSMNTFEPPELMKLYNVYQINSVYAYTMMTFKISTRGSSSISSMWYTDCPWRFVQDENTRVCSALDSIDYARPRNWSTSSNAQQSEIEDHGKEMHGSKDQSPKRWGQMRKKWNRSIGENS